jgi:hypothetical protein
VNVNPDLALAEGYTYDGTNAWTASTCCFNNIPIAMSDVSTAYDTLAVPKVEGFKAWNATQLVRDWYQGTHNNWGLALSSDASKAGDRQRTFASSDWSEAPKRPYLRVRYAVPR